MISFQNFKNGIPRAVNIMNRIFAAWGSEYISIFNHKYELTFHSKLREVFMRDSIKTRNLFLIKY